MSKSSMLEHTCAVNRAWNLLQAEYMQLVKEAFMEKDAMAVIVGLVAEPLCRHPRMSEADGLIVQLVVTFIRNLLVIPDRAITAGQDSILLSRASAHAMSLQCFAPSLACQP